MKTNQWKLYFSLFRITFSISAFTFGGGYIVIPMIRRHFVQQMALISEEELLDMAAIAQSSPGAIAVNIAVLTGYRIGGIWGAVICCMGTVLPPLLILSVISCFYQSFRDNHIVSAVLKGMEAGVAAAIVDVVLDMWQGIVKEKNRLHTFMVPAVFFASFIFRIHVPVIILCCAFLCIILYIIKTCLNKKH